MTATVYVFLATKLSPIAYNYWAVLGLDILVVIFWLISFAVTPSDAGQYNQLLGVYNDCSEELDGYCGHNFEDLSSKTFWNVLRATALFGAFEL